MIVLGGYTRLTNSGLSMTKWKPIEYNYPRNEKQWEEEFNHYKQFPEYAHNPNMTVSDFKKIYFFEYFHRITGSSIGALFLLPFGYFSYRGYLTSKMKYRLGGLLGLGLTQGLIGWWMVKSGLK